MMFLKYCSEFSFSTLAALRPCTLRQLEVTDDWDPPKRITASKAARVRLHLRGLVLPMCRASKVMLHGAFLPKELRLS